MNRNIIDHSTAGGASWGSPLAPGSFYLVANLREINRTKTETKNHLHSYLYKTDSTSFSTILRHLRGHHATLSEYVCGFDHNPENNKTG
jgi:hypothetical protein